jgi:hypothetical protein
LEPASTSNPGNAMKPALRYFSVLGSQKEEEIKQRNFFVLSNLRIKGGNEIFEFNLLKRK